jgi:hypothetical protein
MTQVDHDLTPVNEFDWQLRLIKNLGRHTTSLRMESPDLKNVGKRDIVQELG